MIRFVDALVLAHTKLRTHRIRTGIIVGVASLLFGLMLALIFATQGAYESFQKFSKEGLSNRALVSISHFDRPYPVYDHLEDADFIARVEVKHAAIVEKKAAAAKKFNVAYDAKTSDPSPIVVDEKTGKKSIEMREMRSEAVQAATDERTQETRIPFNVNEYIKSYPSARVLKDNKRLQFLSGESFAYMEKGKDPMLQEQHEIMRSQMGGSELPTLSVVNQTIADTFINQAARFDASNGEIPVVLGFKSAEKQLGLKSLPNEASNDEKLNRLNEVRRRINEITATFCYRNAASQQRVATAVSQQDEMKRNEGNKGYVVPSLQYQLPEATSCGAVGTAKDSRTAAEKRVAENYLQYQKEIGTYLGEPEQYKITVRAIGVSGDVPDVRNAFDLAGTVQMFMASWIGYGEDWFIPASMLKTIPEAKRPAAIFGDLADVSSNKIGYGGSFDSYIVEFSNPVEARTLLNASGVLSASEPTDKDTSIAPYGSGMIMIDELKIRLTQMLLWALLVVGGIAVIILASIIGRAVSEGRRESAIFRAIGARRVDIGSIYGMYALLLSLRVALFALILGLVVAFIVELLFSETATVGAQYAYAATELTTQFTFVSIATWLAPLVLGSVIVFGLLASVIPVIRSARRNPINDMRDDT